VKRSFLAAAMFWEMLTALVGCSKGVGAVSNAATCSKYGLDSPDTELGIAVLVPDTGVPEVTTDEAVRTTDAGRGGPLVRNAEGPSSATDASASGHAAPAKGVSLATLWPIPTPVSGDTNVRGTLWRPDQVTIHRLFVAGIPAMDDGSDFSSFDATLPFSVLAGLASSQGGRLVADFDITALTNCSARPVKVGSGSLIVLLAPKVLTFLSISAPSANGAGTKYFPTTISMPAEIDLTANPEAAGLSVKIWTTMGTINGSAMADVVLSGDGRASARATVFLSPDPTKQGTAYVTAQAPGEQQDSPDASATAATTGINFFGPPTLLPATANLVSGQVLRVEILERGSLLGCSATTAPGLTAKLGDRDLAKGLVILGNSDMSALDGGEPTFGPPAEGITEIVVSADGPATSGSITITCLDIYRQTGSATIGLTKM
jgi:hypothetical protein